MSINTKQLVEHIIKPSLKGLGFDAHGDKSRNSLALILYTCSQESNIGEWIKQRGKGPANGIMQVEDDTHNDFFYNWLIYRQDTIDKINNVCGTNITKDKMPEHDLLIFNLRYSVCVARCQYRRAPEAIPAWNDLDAMWDLYKLRYNSFYGAAKKEEFIANCMRVIEDL